MIRAVVTAVALLVATTGCDRGSTEGRSSGPALSVTKAAAEAALGCPSAFTHTDRPPVLLVHGTASTPEESWSWNLQRSLPAAGWDTCTVRLPDRSMGDIQVSSEYVVAAVRMLHARTGRKVSIVGHSQGALEGRWATKWWPDVRRSIDDLIMLAGPNHGLAEFQSFCAGTACSPAVQQMREGSMFLSSLNLGSEVPAGVSVTSIYSLTDEYVQPATGPAATAALRGASNVTLQSICATKPVDHVAILFNAAAYALIIDALRSPGPADAARVAVSVCAQPTAPAVDLAQGTALVQAVNHADALRTVPGVPAEPPLKPYAVV